MYSEWDSQGKTNKQTNKKTTQLHTKPKDPLHLVLHTRSTTAPSSSQQNIIAKFNSNSFNFTVVTSVIAIKRSCHTVPIKPSNKTSVIC